MLVLTRRNGERLIIGRDIEVIVLKIQGNRVKLGIRGPADVPIHREELLTRLVRPSPDASGGPSLSSGLTVEQQAEEEWEEELGSSNLRSRVKPWSGGIAAMPRRRRAPEDAADRRLERRVRNFLEGLNLPALRDLEVEVRSGAAIIRGNVSSFYQKQLATSCCQRVAGVLSVLNQVRVADSPGVPASPENGSEQPPSAGKNPR